MARKVNQVRWFSGDVNNSNTDINKLAYGTAFHSAPIVQFGIQTLPGVKVIINDHSSITVGSTGIYELSVDGLANINSIRIDANSLNNMQHNRNGYVICDYIYEEE